MHHGDALEVAERALAQHHGLSGDEQVDAAADVGLEEMPRGEAGPGAGRGEAVVEAAVAGRVGPLLAGELGQLDLIPAGQRVLVGHEHAHRVHADSAPAQAVRLGGGASPHTPMSAKSSRSASTISASSSCDQVVYVETCACGCAVVRR